MAFVNILKHYCTTWSTNQEQEGSIYLGFTLWWRLEKKAWILGDLGRLTVFVCKEINAPYKYQGKCKLGVRIGCMASGPP